MQCPAVPLYAPLPGPRPPHDAERLEPPPPPKRCACGGVIGDGDYASGKRTCALCRRPRGRGPGLERRPY